MERLLVGKVLGHRGGRGELTVLVPGGDAGLWVGVREFWIRGPGGLAGRPATVQASRAYRDKLVLKLEGIDGADRAARLRGAVVEVAAERAPELPGGGWLASRLVGAAVVDDRSGRELGRVEDVQPTGGVSLLVVPRAGRDELLIPLAPEIAVDVDPDAPGGGRIRVRLPQGLEDLDAGPEATS